MSAVLSIVGRKGSGKSEVLEKLISLLSERGLRIGVIKHLERDDFEIDQPGKDTFRYRSQGAETVILSGRKRLALYSNLAEELPPEQLLAFFADYDLVFLEGYFQGEISKLEVHRKSVEGPLLTGRMQNVFAVLSDGEKIDGVPHFSFDALTQLALFIEEKLLKKEMEVSS